MNIPEKIIAERLKISAGCETSGGDEYHLSILLQKSGTYCHKECIYICLAIHDAGTGNSVNIVFRKFEIRRVRYNIVIITMFGQIIEYGIAFIQTLGIIQHEITFIQLTVQLNTLFATPLHQISKNELGMRNYTTICFV